MRPTQRSVVAKLRNKIWTAHEVKTPCERQLGSEYSPEMRQWQQNHSALK